jgi:hypothetical protein
VHKKKFYRFIFFPRNSRLSQAIRNPEHIFGWVLSGIFLNPTGAGFLNTIQPNFPATFDYELPRKAVLGNGELSLPVSEIPSKQEKG